MVALRCFYVNDPAKAAKSNLEKRVSNDKKRKHVDEKQQRPKQNLRNVVYETNASSESLTFRRGMNEKKVRRELFILEGSEGFDE
jgi:hypothetical protein